MSLAKHFQSMLAGILLVGGILAAMPMSAIAAPGVDPEMAFTYPGMSPHLEADVAGGIVLSYTERADGADSVKFRVLSGARAGAHGVVTRGTNLFVNWADFPSVVPIDGDFWAAHWLQRQPAGGYAYDIVIALSSDAGSSWSEPFLLHDDGTPTEHGFVTLYPHGDNVGAIWLDGRNMAQDKNGGMTLRSAIVDRDGNVSNEQIIDPLTCDCCQTDVAVTPSGPVAVYRDRSKQEIRDIYVSRFEDDAWLAGRTMHDDGWKIAGCPVNGPVVQANDSAVVVTWFTAAEQTPVAKAAWSLDAGNQFGPPITLSSAGVLGYVGSTMVGDQQAVASWLCRQSDDETSVCLRTVFADGRLGKIRRLPSPGTAERMSVPRIARINDHLLVVWTYRLDGQSFITGRRISLTTVGR